MISFSDKRLYVKGTCQAIASDVTTGQVLYFSNKFQTGNITTSVTMGEIRAGLGNAIAAIIPSDSALNVEFTAADLSLWAKAAQVGANLTYNAPVPTCQTVTASSGTLTLDISGGAPVAQIGYSDVFCFVQEVGEQSFLATDGIQYPLDESTGVISGFAATSGKQYKVWYWTNKAAAQIASISTLFDPKVVHFVAQMAVYSNESSDPQQTGTRVGWLYTYIPRLKMAGNAGIVGDQTTNDTTSMSGQAIAYDDDTVSANCTDCNASNLAYYVYVPDSGANAIKQVIAGIGGSYSMLTSSNAQVQPYFIMENGELVRVTAYSDFTYAISTSVTGLSVSSTGLLTSGTTEGTGAVTVTYVNGTETLTGTASVVIAAPAQ